ncbi:hypothetical protein CK203_047648 [Vitis vinifera]|uniref:Uncharacterized protein n=1 Tax=Vitis vinifera TaxID=29760 RepID=A0A438H5E2_VITVI|nr:hypothetical protein CK203_047648 [Vitis vinifera]
MSHSVFAPQIMPVAPTKTIYSSNPLLPIHTLSSLRPAAASASAFAKRRSLAVRASSSALVDGDSVALLERCFLADSASVPSSSASAMPLPVMKGKYGSFGAVTLEKSKLDLSQKQSRLSPEDRKIALNIEEEKKRDGEWMDKGLLGQLKKASESERSLGFIRKFRGKSRTYSLEVCFNNRGKFFKIQSLQQIKELSLWWSLRVVEAVNWKLEVWDLINGRYPFWCILGEAD